MTLIARAAHQPDIDWDYRSRAGTATVFLESTAALRHALRAGTESGFDIGRVIVDRAGTGEDFLHLLTALPPEYTGDALFIRDTGGGFLSATGRGGDRLLYALRDHDVRFYLEAHNLVTSRVAMLMTA
jgi:hypothetical protein